MTTGATTNATTCLLKQKLQAGKCSPSLYHRYNIIISAEHQTVALGFLPTRRPRTLNVVLLSWPVLTDKHCTFHDSIRAHEPPRYALQSSTKTMLYFFYVISWKMRGKFGAIWCDGYRDTREFLQHIGVTAWFTPTHTFLVKFLGAWLLITKMNDIEFLSVQQLFQSFTGAITIHVNYANISLKVPDQKLVYSAF